MLTDESDNADDEENVSLMLTDKSGDADDYC